MKRKQFHLGDLLSVTTGRLLSPVGIKGVYNILNHLTGANLFTHELPYAAKVCTPYLEKQFPFLKEITEIPEFNGSKEAVIKWLKEMGEVYGEFHIVEQLPKEAFQRKSLVEILNELKEE